MKIFRLLYLLLPVTCTVLIFSGCAKDKSAASQDTAVDAIFKDHTTIRDYLRSKGQDSGVISHPSGLSYKIMERGNGDYINREQVPTVVYSRKLLLSEKEVESSLGLPTNLDGRQLKNHITGWQIGLQIISKGGRIIMYIPSSLAFGPTGVPGVIPPNAILICDVTLVSFK